MQERSQAERRVSTGPAAGFDEGQAPRKEEGQVIRSKFCTYLGQFNLGDFNLNFEMSPIEKQSCIWSFNMFPREV